jgi:adenylylsulfate kinase
MNSDTTKNNLTKHEQVVTKLERQNLLKQKSPVIWLTGLSGSGKSTIANELARQLFEMGKLSYILDGDNIRLGLNKDLGFSDDDRKENIRRIAETAKLFSDAGVITITAFISPFINDRELAKEIIGESDFFEIFVDSSLELCETRDPKGLYKKARTGEIKMFTGIDSPYEKPINPFMVLKTENTTPEDLAKKIIKKITFYFLWEKINHGGEPTNNKDKKYAIFIGRFQPPHLGHFQLIEQKLNEGVPALIMVRDIEPDEKNPFTTEQTINMVEKYHHSKGHDVKVMSIPDIESVNFGRGVGYEINEFIPPKDLAFISATKIRESIKNGDDTWRNMVDESIQNDVIEYLKL